MKQLTLFKNSYRKSFGGELLTNKRKSRRPLNLKRPLHLVMRADISKSGSLCKKSVPVKKLIDKYAAKFKIVIYERAIVSNHTHLIIKFNSRADHHAFVRALAGRLAQLYKIKWTHRPFTRIVTWGRDFLNAKKYVLMNALEAAKIIPYQKRKIYGPRHGLSP